MGTSWLIGALLAATGSIASNLGVNCQKYSFMKNALLPKHLQKKHIRQPGWLFGMALVTLGSIGDFAALSIAAQSIVAPIGSITLVANVVFAHYWLKEQVSWIEVLGTSLIVCGSVLAVAFGDHSDTQYDIHAILTFFYGTTFVIYAIISILFSFALWKFQQPITPVKQKIVDATKRYELAYDANDRGSMEYEDFYIASLQHNYGKYEKVHPFTLCALSGILGGQSVMFGKMVGELISTTLDGNNQLLSPFLYIFIILMFACVVFQLKYLAIALSFFDALYVVPVFQCFFISCSTLGGACFFNEFALFSTTQAILFPIGLLMTLAGVVVLTKRKMTDGSKDRKRMSDAEREAESQMEPIEEGDEAYEEHPIDEQEDSTSSIAASSKKLLEEEKSIVQLIQKRHERRKRRRLLKIRRRRMKNGYQGLYDEDESTLNLNDQNEEEMEEIDPIESDLFGVSSEEESSESETEESFYSTATQHLPQILQRKSSEESKTADERVSLHPSVSPIQRTSPLPNQRRSSVTFSTPSPVVSSLTPSSAPSSRTGSPHHANMPAIDDQMSSAAAAIVGVTPVSSSNVVPERRHSGGSVAVTSSITPVADRRSSLERRTTIPRRQSRSPIPLFVNPDESHSTPGTPTSLQRQPSLFRSTTLSPSAAPSFMHPSTQMYMAPPTGASLDLLDKSENIGDKVKKYSSVAHIAGGLVGVPLVSAIAHAYAIAKEERNEEIKEMKEKEEKKKEEEKKGEENLAALAAANPPPPTTTIPTATTGIAAAEDTPKGAQIEGIELQPVGEHIGTANEVKLPVNEGGVLIPVAEPVNPILPVSSSSSIATPAATDDNTPLLPRPPHHPSASMAFIGMLKNRIQKVFEGEGKDKDKSLIIEQTPTQEPAIITNQSTNTATNEGGASQVAITINEDTQRESTPQGTSATTTAESSSSSSLSLSLPSPVSLTATPSETTKVITSTTQQFEGSGYLPSDTQQQSESDNIHQHQEEEETDHQQETRIPLDSTSEDQLDEETEDSQLSDEISALETSHLNLLSDAEPSSSTTDHKLLFDPATDEDDLELK